MTFPNPKREEHNAQRKNDPRANDERQAMRRPFRGVVRTGVVAGIVGTLAMDARVVRAVQTRWRHILVHRLGVPIGDRRVRRRTCAGQGRQVRGEQGQHRTARQFSFADEQRRPLVDWHVVGGCRRDSAALPPRWDQGRRHHRASRRGARATRCSRSWVSTNPSRSTTRRHCGKTSARTSSSGPRLASSPPRQAVCEGSPSGLGTSSAAH